MGEGEVKGDWVKAVRKFVEEISRQVPLEAAIIHGSAARSGLGFRSDIDVLIVSDYFANLSFEERMEILERVKAERIQALAYTFSELESMVRRANPLALGALIEGISLFSSERLRELGERARKMYSRRGRFWIQIK